MESGFGIFLARKNCHGMATKKRKLGGGGEMPCVHPSN